MIEPPVKMAAPRITAPRNHFEDGSVYGMRWWIRAYFADDSLLGCGAVTRKGSPLPRRKAMAPWAPVWAATPTPSGWGSCAIAVAPVLPEGAFGPPTGKGDAEGRRTMEWRDGIQSAPTSAGRGARLTVTHPLRRGCRPTSAADLPDHPRLRLGLGLGVGADPAEPAACDRRRPLGDPGSDWQCMPGGSRTAVLQPQDPEWARQVAEATARLGQAHDRGCPVR